jgi:hypothetical protein
MILERAVDGAEGIEITEDCYSGYDWYGFPMETPDEYKDTVIGYGWSGLNNGGLEAFCEDEDFQLLLKSTDTDIKQYIKDLLIKFGWSIKKVVDITTGVNISSDCFWRNRPFCVDYNYMAAAGSGFCGSVCIRTKNNIPAYLGLYGAEVRGIEMKSFVDEIKGKIMNQEVKN